MKKATRCENCQYWEGSQGERLAICNCVYLRETPEDRITPFDGGEGCSNFWEREADDEIKQSSGPVNQNIVDAMSLDDLRGRLLALYQEECDEKTDIAVSEGRIRVLRIWIHQAENALTSRFPQEPTP